MRRFFSAVLGAALLAAVLPPGAATAATSVGGPLTSDTTWTPSGSPYILTSSVTVADGVTLTIEPGVRVEASGEIGLFVVGHIRAIGSESNPIIFTSSTAMGWSGISMNDGHDIGEGVTGSVFRYAVIEKSHGFGLNYRGYAPSVDHVVFRDNRFGIYVWYPGAEVAVTDSVFLRNDTAILGVADPTVTITDNEFLDNDAAFHICGNPSRGERWEIHRNDIPNNVAGQPDFMIEGSCKDFTVNAQDNWWGTTDPNLIEGAILHGWDDPSKATVDWDPPSSAPHDSTSPSSVLYPVADAGDGRIALHWSASTSDAFRDFDVSHYVVRRSTSPETAVSGTQVFSGVNTSFTDAGLSNDVTYHYAIYAVDDAGNLSSPAEISGTPFAPEEHVRTVSLTLRRHLKAKGSVSSANAASVCVQDVAVRLQKRKSGRWRTIATVRTSFDGVYRKRLRDRAGKYRATLPKITTEEDVCLGARSAVQRHTH